MSNSASFPPNSFEPMPQTSRPCRMTRWMLAALLVLLVACLPAAWAQDQGLEIDIVGGNVSALPIAVVPFSGDGGGTDVAAVIRADFERSGAFRVLPVGQMPAQPDNAGMIDVALWRGLRQDYIVVGRVVPDASGLRTEYELVDLARNERLLAMALTAGAGSMRDVAHQIADAVYERITGVRGAFWTRIAYVTANGLGRNTRYALMVADADGHNPMTVVESSEPILSPAWSPDGRRLAYVSFELGNSAIFVQDVTTGAREAVTSFRGINAAPSFSPDGRRLAMSLSRSGNPEIYVMDLGSRGLTQVTNHFGIDTEPVWSADGASLYFTSDRGGRPQIYRVSAGGGTPTRITFDGSYNATPTVSADGRKIAVAQGSGNNYRIALMDSSLGSARWSLLSPGSMDETPSFAPNATMVVYAGRGALHVVSADGRVRERLSVRGGNVREPAWGPYRQPR